MGLTVAPLDAGLPPEPGRRPARLTEVLPPAARSRDGVAPELRRLQRQQAQLAAYQAALVAQLVERHDPEGGEREFFVDELAVTPGASMTSTGHTWSQADTLVRHLPGTWAALADGDPPAY